MLLWSFTNLDLILGQVVTLVSRMELVRGVRFRRSLLAVFDYWLDGAHKLQTCRKNEIINRKKYRVDSRGLIQKEKGKYRERKQLLFGNHVLLLSSQESYLHCS